MRIAVLGTGRMGTALARRLLSGGHEVVVWNRSPEKAREVVDAGAQAAMTPSGAMEVADVALTSLSDDAAVREVALGKGGVIEWAKDGAPYIETSTVSPQLTGELAGLFSSFAAVPVLGGPATVLAGEATYLVGTADATFQRIEPLLTSFGGQVRRYGSAPLASAAKLAVNLLLLSHAVSLAESFAVGRAGGLSDDQLRELLGGLAAPGVKNRFEALLGSVAQGWWTTALGAKDASLAVELARLGGADLQVAQAVRDAYFRAARTGHANEDIAAVRHLYDLSKDRWPQK
jgi:3-hydroxyisobutyrate dehydrogenase-like beta-hydroxyacid dehydrogenase